jgi:hypothetical protein
MNTKADVQRLFKLRRGEKQAKTPPPNTVASLSTPSVPRAIELLGTTIA